MNAAEWLAREAHVAPQLALLGAPVSRASISPSQAWSTPPAFRHALRRYSTWDSEREVDLEDLAVRDLGDLEGDRDDPDAAAAHSRILAATARAGVIAPTVAVIGGDNSLTRPALQGLMAQRPREAWGLLTLDAHHDCRPADQGSRNGTPVRELIEQGLPGDRVVQIGIQPFANERAHATWASAQGVRVHPRAEVASVGIATVVRVALTSLTRAGVTAVYADIDVDVVDRAFAPACPASLPGGISPAELLTATHALGRDRRVAGVDLTEVDANADNNSVTVRLLAAAFLAFCSGVLLRRSTDMRA